MPIYLYVDLSGHEIEIHHSMDAVVAPFCPICKRSMHRKPQAPNVNWNGLPPHLEHNNPVIREMIDGAPQRCDDYLKTHEG